MNVLEKVESPVLEEFCIPVSGQALAIRDVRSQDTNLASFW